jgi:hypothetical protein
MSAPTLDLSSFVTPVTDTLTSSAAFTAYGAIAGAGVLIGTGIKMGPKLFRYLWKFIPS